MSAVLAAATDPPALVVVEGEAGVGKSRLLLEFLAHRALDERLKLVGHCHPVRQPFPLGPVLEAMHRLGARLSGVHLSPVAGVLRSVLPEIAPNLPPAPDPLIDPRAERHRVFRALRELLRALGPTVCALEDIHWAEDDTLEFLRFLLADIPEQLVLVLTARREESDVASAQMELVARLPAQTARAVVPLPPLDRDDVRRLVAAILGIENVSDEFAHHLHERTGGLPFAVEEVVRLLQAREDLVRLDGGWARRELHRLQVPRAVRDSVLARVGQLGDDARLVTEAIAVVGRPASEALIARVAGLSRSRTGRGLLEGLSQALLTEVEPGLYESRHGLARQAVYGAILGPRRQQLHGRTARSLEIDRPRPFVQLAHHYRHAGRPNEWARSAEAAADVAAGLGDDRTAAALLLEVLSVPHLQRTVRSRVSLKLGPVALYGAVHGPAIDALRETIRDVSLARVVRGELRFSMSRLLHEQGETRAAYAELLTSVGELGRSPTLAARAMVNLAIPDAAWCHVDEHLEWLERATKLADGEADEAVGMAITVRRAAVPLYLGDPAAWLAAQALPKDASSGEAQLELLRGYYHLAMAAMFLGYDSRAEAFLDEAERLRTELESLRWIPWLGTMKASLRWARGDWTGLEADVRSLLAATEEIPRWALNNRIILGSLLRSQGELQAAESHLTLAFEAASRTESLPALAASAGALAGLHLARGDRATGVDVAQRAVDGVDAKGVWVWAGGLAPVAVEALLACDRHADAQDLVSEFAKGVACRDAPAASAALVVCRGLVANRTDPAGGAQLFARAAQAWRDQARPYEELQAIERQARCLLAADDPSGGDLLRHCVTAFTGLGATWDAARARHALRAHGIPLGRRGGRRRYGNELSPREAEIAGLVSTGQSSREIATTLFLSPRTVEDHVAAVMRKLGVKSRKAIGTAISKDP